jgi:hypothetical protein
MQLTKLTTTADPKTNKIDNLGITNNKEIIVQQHQDNKDLLQEITTRIDRRVGL